MLDDLKTNNREWARRGTASDADFFGRQKAGQSPDYLWIGCSDSRVPANEIVGLGPGEMFVHRNIANLASPKDASCRSVLQYAVQVLKVKHILVVGHYGCGGVAAAAGGKPEGPVGRWIAPIRKLARTHKRELKALPQGGARFDRLVELNVVAQVRNVASDEFVQQAWKQGQPLCVHGWVYGIGDGLITDLGVDVGGAPDLERLQA